MRAETMQVWARELHNRDVAVAVRNLFTMGSGARFRLQASMVGWPESQKFKARDLYAHMDVGVEVDEAGRPFVGMLVRPGGVQMFRLSRV
jgi:hypothetical protein